MATPAVESVFFQTFLSNGFGLGVVIVFLETEGVKTVEVAKQGKLRVQNTSVFGLKPNFATFLMEDVSPPKLEGPWPQSPLVWVRPR